MSSGTYLASSFLYINLGCHMMFILKNRLQAQSIPTNKTFQIIDDLTSAIFKQKLIQTMLIPQQPMSINTFKELFRKLAHSSIMKLDQSSMQKLLYLILMTIKKETFQTSSPLELYALTVGNLRTLQSYAKGAPSEALLQKDINIFTSKASKYSFTQYVELKEYLLTMLEPYQTKVINFQQSGAQDGNGKLTFIRRNHHNTLPLGSGKNHPNLQLQIPKGKTTEMPLKQWAQWKTSLVIDHASEYQRQSERRKISSGSGWNTGKEKGLDDMFNLGKIDDYEVKLDLFDYGEQSKRPKIQNMTHNANEQEQKLPQITKKGKVDEKIRGKIEKQFGELNKKASQQEELDLLDMMDN